MRVSRPLTAALALAAAVSLAAPAQALAVGRRPAAGRVPCADPVLDAPVGGETAVRQLGSDLAEAADNLDRSPAQYRRLLRSDRTLRVDRCAQTFVVEPAATHAERAAVAAPAAAAPEIAATAAFDNSGDTWALSSRPGAEKTIFLDFDGALVSGSVWNSATYGVSSRFSPGLNTEGSATTFSTGELAMIRSAWLQVAEDYAAFDVNVTTQDPGQERINRSDATDTRYGTRVLITTDADLETRVCGRCGGIAYLDKFAGTTRHDYYQPALVFPVDAANTAKGIGEAAAHEVGHTLGLQHDGQVAKPDGTGATEYYGGQGYWAPIMGSGYSKPVTQWSNGTYERANNGQDDVRMIGERLGYAEDDHADTSTGATAVIYGGAAVDGLLGRSSSDVPDVDWFTFAVPEGSTSMTLQVSPQKVEADLDVSLTVRTPAGNEVTVAPPLTTTGPQSFTGLGAQLTVPSPASGTYTARVAGDGFSGTSTAAGYSDYASLGRYTVALTGEGGDVLAPVEPAPDATVGVDYSYALPASGGVRPYTWTVDDPTPDEPTTGLPDGVTLSSSGILVGRATEPGSFTANLRVTDKEGRSAARPVTVEVVAAPLHTVEQPPAPPAPTETPTPAPTQTTSPTTSPTTPPATPTPTTTPTIPPPVNPGPSHFAGSLRAAVAALPVRAETGAGYAAARFPLVDADRDCRSTRTEVLQADSRRAVTWTSRKKCAVRSGSWLSLLDRRSATRATQVTAVWTVPLAEAWQSGARGWSTARRRAYANDLGDTRTLLAVTTRSARARADREPTAWLPPVASRCTYVADWVAAKLRWGLTADARETSTLARVATGCASTRIVVARR